MSNNSASETINSFLKFGIRPGLERIEKLLNLIGNPQKNLKCIHIAGTNGKGSISSFISSILRESGYKVGLYISPFVTNFRERIQVNGEMISEKSLEETLDYVNVFVEQMKNDGEIITEFELITTIALMYFSNQNCDIVVLETGLGGRFDATNVIESPLASVITHIALDHTKILGDTLSKIAYEKAGIIKENSVTVVYPDQEREALEVIEDVAEKRKNNLVIPNLEAVEDVSVALSGSNFTYKGDLFSISLLGRHQIKNAITAIETIYSLKYAGIDINIDCIKKGLKKVKFPARMEVVSLDPLVILDGSHNPDSILALKETIGEIIPFQNNVAIVGMLKDKDIESSLSILSSCFKKVITVDISNSRAIGSKELANIAKSYFPNVYYSNSIDEALNMAMDFVNKEESNLIVFGSLYLAGEIREKIISKII